MKIAFFLFALFSLTIFSLGMYGKWVEATHKCLRGHNEIHQVCITNYTNYCGEYAQKQVWICEQYE